MSTAAGIRRLFAYGLTAAILSGLAQHLIYVPDDPRAWGSVCVIVLWMTYRHRRRPA
jgi:hypothetical protein